MGFDHAANLFQTVRHVWRVRTRTRDPLDRSFAASRSAYVRARGATPRSLRERARQTAGGEQSLDADNTTVRGRTGRASGVREIEGCLGNCVRFLGFPN